MTSATIHNKTLLLICGLTSGLLSCSAAPPRKALTTGSGKALPKQPPPRSALTPAQFVLLRREARLHRMPDTEGRFIHPPLSTPASPAEVQRYRLVAHHGDWLELETLPRLEDPDQQHCYPPDPDFAGLRLRLYAHRLDVVESTQFGLTRHYPDATSTRVTAGVALSAPLPLVAQPGERIRHTEIDGVSLNLEIPDSAVGLSYAPTKHLPQASAAGQASIALDGRLPLHFGLGALAKIERPQQATVVDSASGQLRVLLHRPCLELEALLESRVNTGVHISSKGPPHPKPDKQSKTGVAILRPGATLLWPQGGVAGQATLAARFEAVVSTTPTRVCLRRTVLIYRGGAGDDAKAHPLVVCVDPSELIRP